MARSRSLFPLPLTTLNLPLIKLSEMTGISVNALSKMGRSGGTGAKQITYEVLEKICKALDCTVADFKGDSLSMKREIGDYVQDIVRQNNFL